MAQSAAEIDFSGLSNQASARELSYSEVLEPQAVAKAKDTSYETAGFELKKPPPVFILKVRPGRPIDPLLQVQLQ